LRFLVVIPARGGSKGLPGKNIKVLNGKPLIHYTIEQARSVFSDQSIIISTDSEEIKKVAEETGIQVPFLRPESLATDYASSRGVLLHAVNYFRKNNPLPDAVVLLQVTSPLRTSVQINEAVQLFNSELDLVVSVKETDANPYYVLYEEDSVGFLKKVKSSNFLRRQDCPKVWELNGAIYVIKTEHLLDKEIMDTNKIVKFEMDKRSSIDIDDEIDFLFAQMLLTRNDNT
jgi:N-acylneuraminate cytidylyltransferase